MKRNAPIRLRSGQAVTRPIEQILSARRMKQSANWLGLRELVIQRHSMLRWQYVHRNLPFLQKIQGLGRDMKALGHSTREHDNFRPVFQQFLHVGDLNTGTVRGICLAPVPFV